LGWNGRIRTYRGAPFTGIAFRLYPNGIAMFEIPYIDGRADGLMRE
jgi:antitoxin component YwqK of YwqJK toxin-antitoxin module